jgi:hypothetical protein
MLALAAKRVLRTVNLISPAAQFEHLRRSKFAEVLRFLNFFPELHDSNLDRDTGVISAIIIVSSSLLPKKCKQILPQMAMHLLC